MALVCVSWSLFYYYYCFFFIIACAFFIRHLPLRLCVQRRYVGRVLLACEREREGTGLVMVAALVVVLVAAGDLFCQSLKKNPFSYREGKRLRENDIPVVMLRPTR